MNEQSHNPNIEHRTTQKEALIELFPNQHSYSSVYDPQSSCDQQQILAQLGANSPESQDATSQK